MPTLTQMEYMVAVDEQRHFGRAAEVCHVSQPSLSAQIQKVEEELNVIIFDRTKKPVLTTEKGRLIIDQAKAVLKEHEKLLTIGQLKAGEVAGDFKLAIIPTIAPYLLPLFIEDFCKKYPLINLTLDEQKTEDIILHLKQDKIDAAILATPLGIKNFHERPLYYEPFYLYMHKNHPLTKYKTIKESQLEARDIWLLDDGHCFKNQVVSFCHLKASPDIYSNFHFKSSNFETLKYVIQATKGYTLFPQLFISTLSKEEQRNQVRAFQQSVPTREVSLVFRRDQWKKDIVNALNDCIKGALPKDLPRKPTGKMEVLGI